MMSTHVLHQLQSPQQTGGLINPVKIIRPGSPVGPPYSSLRGLEHLTDAGAMEVGCLGIGACVDLLLLMRSGTRPLKSQRLVCRQEGTSYLGLGDPLGILF